jgi:membrane protease YdiL (CAAX protease family)
VARTGQHHRRHRGDLVVSTVLSFVAVAIDVALGNLDAAAVAEGRITMTPSLLAATNVGLAAAAILAFLAHRFIIGLRWGWFHSVIGRIRWSWLALTCAVVLPVYLLFGASSLFDPTYQDLRIDGTVIAFIVIILLTTPLQAAAEEYMFRGVVQRSAGSWIRSPRWSFVVGTAVSAPLFAMFHFAQDPWLILYYLCFGILLSILTQQTGGLEAAIVIHVANNVFNLMIGALAGQMTEGFDRSEGQGGPFMLVPIVILIVVVAVLWLLGKRRKVETTTAEAAGPGQHPDQ